MVGNFISTVLFCGASWMFVHRRIPFEEQTLLKMFPNEYPEYFKSTIIGIPFIRTTGNLSPEARSEYKFLHAMGQYVAWHARKLYNSLPEKSYEFVFSQI
jgi:hypothetical protein